MTDLQIARMLGAALAIFGLLSLIIMGATPFTIVKMILVAVVSLFSLLVVSLGILTLFVGVVWVIKPQRAIDTIARSRRPE